MLAEMARDVAAARALTREAAAAKDRGEPLAEVSSLAKWTASDAAMRVATDAVQLFGGERLFAGDRHGAADARREGRPDLRGHEPDPSPESWRDEVLEAGRSAAAVYPRGMTLPNPDRRRRLHRQRRADADRQVRRGAQRRPGHRARRRRDPGGRRARGPRPGDGASRRGPHGPGPAGRRPGRRRRGRRYSRPASRTTTSRDDHQPRLRLGAEGDHARRRRDQGGRRRGRRRRRHGVDEPGAVPRSRALASASASATAS